MISSAQKNKPPITTLAFVTADRPQVFNRSLASYLEHFRSHERQITTVVTDDSRSSEARAQYLESLAQSGSDIIRYIGRPEKLKFIEQLGRQGIDPEAARFAIGGHFVSGVCTTGANRNCILLDTIGELVLSADDDTVCSVVSHPQRDEFLTIGNHENPREVWFYTSRTEVTTCQSDPPGDLLASHERLLGKSLSEIVAEATPNQMNVDGSCRHLLAALHRPNAKVVCTMSGMAGDSGAGNPQCFLLGSKQVLESLNESEAMSRRAFASREVLWVSRSHTITHCPQCQGSGLGMANNDLLPPFFPVGRNEDAIFGALNLMAQNSFLAHLPIALLHDAETGRRYERLPSFSIASLILSLVWDSVPKPKTALEAALRSVGLRFLELANLPHQEFWEIVAQAVDRQAARTLSTLESNRTAMGDCSPYLEAEIESYRRHLCGLMNNDSRHFIPHEFQKSESMESTAIKTQRLVHDAGILWRTWPDLVEAAAFLKSRNVRISMHALDVKN